MTRIAAIIAFTICTGPLAASAQDAPCDCAKPKGPPPVWTGAVSAGLALTAGNSDTSNISLAADMKRDAGTPWVFKAGALYLRGEQNDLLAVDRQTFHLREDYRFSPRAFVFGQFQYLRDEFQQVDYLMGPSAGVGYELVKTEPTSLTVDGGLGVVWEKNPALDVRSSGAVTAGEAFTHRLSPVATVTQSFTALWKMEDFGDALYAFGAGITADITPRSALKAELLNNYKSEPVGAGTKSNDVAILMSLSCSRSDGVARPRSDS